MAEFPKYIDTHCHLNHRDFKEDWYDVANRALEKETWMIVVGSDYSSSQRAVEIADHFPNGVYAAIGVHPLHHKASPLEATASNGAFDLNAFQELAKHPKVVAIGEIGLDFHDCQIQHSQQATFSNFLELAEELKLPIILHARDAYDKVLEYLAKFDSLSGIIHHFTGAWSTADKFLHHNFLLSFTGFLARAHTRHEVIAKTPLAKMAVESECPYLVPEPVGIGRGDPAYIDGTVGTIAALKGIDQETAAREITRNVLRMFPKILRAE